MMPYDLMLVDGYNAIYHWEKAGVFKSGEYDYRREQLINTLSNFAGFWQVPCIIVFDAHLVRYGLGTDEQVNNWVRVVFTAEGQSADSWIERYSSELSSSGKEIVVVSSDWTEQTVILGHGSHRMSVRDLLMRIKQTNELINNKFIKYPGVAQRSWLVDNLPPGIRDHLEKMRHDPLRGKREKRSGNNKKE